MDTDRRIGLMDAYFRALDQDDPDVLYPALASECVYLPPTEELRGRDCIYDYLVNERVARETVHKVTFKIHDTAASVCRGHVVDSDGLTVQFANVFEFDDGEKSITRIEVYTR